jgi:hypothetical protein
MKYSFVLLCIVLIFTGKINAGTTYFVDDKSGDDANKGTEMLKPWKTLERVNSITLGAGDKVLFKAGSRYSGQFKPIGRGAKEAPIVLGMFGEGPKPRFDGEGNFESTIYIYNMEYVVLENLEVTNTGPESMPGRRGVKIHLVDFGTAHGITLRKLFIHDVNGSIYKKKGGGGAIFWHNQGKNIKSRFDGLLIEDCHLKDCVRNGINARGYGSRQNWCPSLNVVVRRCLLEGIPGDGIVPLACDGALIEHNVMRDCPRMLETGDAAAGIWPFSCDNTIIQFNEVSDHKAPWDAQGFDSDWNCRNTIIQYNYSHDNEGGFLLICNNGGAKKSFSIGNQGTIVRYNISVNDGLRVTGKHEGFSPTIHISGPVMNSKIYNNVIVIPQKPEEGIDRKVLKMDNWGGPWPEGTLFANNIFYVEGEGIFELGKDKNTVFKNNVFYGKIEGLPNQESLLSSDPMFKGLLGGGVNGFESLGVFMLQKNSPYIEKAMPIPNNGGRDFFGNPVPENGPFSIGVHEAQGL